MISDLSVNRTPDLSVSTSRISTLLKHAQYTATPRQNMDSLHFDASNCSEESNFNSISDSEASPEDTIRRLVSVGDFSSAVYWIDSVYAKECEGDGKLDLVKLANYVKALTSVQEWMRVSAVLENNRLQNRHLVFGYYYVNALFHRKMFAEIPVAPIGNLLEEAGLPVKYPQLPGGISLTYSLGQDHTLMQEEKTVLDKMAHELRLCSAIMLVYGRTFLHLENRESAGRCLLMALYKDPQCIMAQQLLNKFKLVNEKDKDKFTKILDHRAKYDAAADPRVRTALAEKAFSRGDAKSALALTGRIIYQHGLYMDCLLVHINSLVQLEDADALFLLAHRLVDAMPEHEYSWYAVSLYYHVCRNSTAAKNFMNKASMMNTGFGEGWLAYGHILSADSENEQALNCYYRASRILERHFEPLLYVAMQYCKSGVELADQFLNDAARLAPTNPVVLHEQGTLAFNKKDFPAARTLLEKALRLVLAGDEQEPDMSKPFSIKEFRHVPIDVYWEPLITNLGHTARRIGAYEEAIAYHHRALLLCPRNVSGLTSLGISHACLGQMSIATQFLHRALSISPYDELARSALAQIVGMQISYVGPGGAEAVDTKMEVAAGGSSANSANRSSLMDMNELDELLTNVTPVQKNACLYAMRQKKCAAAAEAVGVTRGGSPSRILPRRRASASQRDGSVSPGPADELME